ncbi:uncharacterized protein SPAPADRAFT_68090 [Spathaspora passalidarum NRRL Y-27907]|uniref:Uncharacterized protein n=1 Tax=Spathaspora passalidarum (strain NRRL Y-27907 / 11-Y1) TaxID=619300 RepID=G3AT93_SPAPN|nr:uncharacterized protein SPAPADRAFT_68090 [Spathaspora passalidarum NRRL Y-27907]EGW30856.1 hypothetical protein SPAPADRAFT_68090 [Spathaspora passalidarum NRRL Y-27907]
MDCLTHNNMIAENRQYSFDSQRVSSPEIDSSSCSLHRSVDSSMFTSHESFSQQQFHGMESWNYENSNLVGSNSNNNLCDQLQIETCDESTLDSEPTPTWDKHTTTYRTQDNTLKLQIWIDDNKLSFKLRKDRLESTTELVNVILFKLKVKLNMYPDRLQITFKDQSLNPISLFEHGETQTPELLLEYIQLKKTIYIRAIKQEG